MGFYIKYLLSTMPLTAPCSKISQSLPPIDAISNLAEGLWVDRRIALTNYTVMGVLSMHLMWVGDGKGKKRLAEM